MGAAAVAGCRWSEDLQKAARVDAPPDGSASPGSRCPLDEAGDPGRAAVPDAGSFRIFDNISS